MHLNCFLLAEKSELPGRSFLFASRIAEEVKHRVGIGFIGDLEVDVSFVTLSRFFASNVSRFDSLLREEFWGGTELQTLGEVPRKHLRGLLRKGVAAEVFNFLDGVPASGDLTSGALRGE